MHAKHVNNAKLITFVTTFVSVLHTFYWVLVCMGKLYAVWWGITVSRVKKRKHVDVVNLSSFKYDWMQEVNTFVNGKWQHGFTTSLNAVNSCKQHVATRLYDIPECSKLMYKQQVATTYLKCRGRSTRIVPARAQLRFSEKLAEWRLGRIIVVLKSQFSKTQLLSRWSERS